MTRFFPAVVCLFAFLISESSQAQRVRAAPKSGLYLAGYGGLHFPSDNDSDVFGFDGIEWDSGYRLGGRLGYRRGNFRYEVEIGYRTADGELDFNNIFLNDLDIDLGVLQGSLNVLYDIGGLSLGSIDTTPYLGAGLGYANVEFDGDVVDDESGAVLLIEAGATLRLASSLSIVPAYRYEYVAVEILNDDALTAHGFQVGVRLDF